MASKHVFIRPDEQHAVLFAEDRRRSNNTVYVPVLIALIMCILILATSVVILSHSKNLPCDTEVIFRLQEQIDALRSQLQSNQDCNNQMVRVKRQADNQLSIPSSNRNGTGTGLAQLFLGPPSNITMEGRWKLFEGANQQQFMYFGSTILHWKEGNVFDPTHYELPCNGAIKVLQSGVYYIRAQISLTTLRNMEAINIISKGKVLVVMQTNTLAKVSPQKETDYGFFHVLNPSTYAYLEAGSEILVQTMTLMNPRTAIIMSPAASHISLQKISG